MPEVDGPQDKPSLRQDIVDFLRRELVGPDPGFPAIQLNGEEILRSQDPPRMRYSAGVLFPTRTMIEEQDNAGELDTDDDEDGDGEGSSLTLDGGAETADDADPDPAVEAEPELTALTDRDINRANEYLPSAMGLSALARIGDRLCVRVQAATYVERELVGATKKRARRIGYWRLPFEVDVVFTREELCGPETVTARKPVCRGDEPCGMEVSVVSRPRPYANDTRLVTFALVNTTVGRSRVPQDEECFYQCGFSVFDPDSDLTFQAYPDDAVGLTDEDDASMRLLYHHRLPFAVGHGCAPNWSDVKGEAVARVWTETLAVAQTTQMIPTSGDGLSMRELASGDQRVVLDTCRSITVAYRAWIEDTEQTIDGEDGPPAALRGTALRHTADCRECLRRIEEGIATLETDSYAFGAFRLMNRAMLMQHLHYERSVTQTRAWTGRGGTLERRFDPPDHESSERSWYPFQLAFILMNLRSMTDPHCEDHDLVDLLWFPTGGGKTEAYLGLAAFAIFRRRLLDPDSVGTVALMRYTLRLLTVQQFQRTASLICACEYLRQRDEERLGDTSITVGLWVGRTLTPNTNADAVKCLTDLIKTGSGNRFALLSCPWCGAQMGPVRVGKRVLVKGYHQLRDPKRVSLGCDDPDCEFHGRDSLPLLVVDEQMYENPPTLIIGTADKFAMLTWRHDASRLFGLRNGLREHRPPELIIQDELHLMAGPLGSMVGHYECVIEEFCSEIDGAVRRTPKVIASTATISHAREQIQALYGRDPDQARVFPPPGISSRDSFFSREAPERPGRCFVGVLNTGASSHIASQTRVLAALTQAPGSLSHHYEGCEDTYWTLTAYFNSIRELGHAASLLRADIAEYLKAMWQRMGHTRQVGLEELLSRRRYINRDVELTSRVPSERIPEALGSLFEPRSDDAQAIDVCLATNMIQVGIDIPRLNLMVLVGQPKTTSEYIQASSRIGRSDPGLVVTIYNPARPRDRSHFEHFRAYHETIYRNVEPTSVTPFSAPVCERALHAVAIALIRGFRTDGGDPNSALPIPDPALFHRVRTVILDRARRVNPDTVPGVEQILDDFIEHWRRTEPPVYGGFFHTGPEVPLMYPPGRAVDPQWEARSFETPSSMRHVDAACDAGLIHQYPAHAADEEDADAGA